MCLRRCEDCGWMWQECRGPEGTLSPRGDFSSRVDSDSRDPQPRQQSHVQLLLITGDSAKQCLNSPCLCSLSLSVCLSCSISIFLSYTTIITVFVINAHMHRSIETSATCGMYCPSFHIKCDDISTNICYLKQAERVTE